MSRDKENITGVAVKPHQVELIKEKVALPAAGNVLIEIKASAICGGDIKLFFGKHPFVQLPAALGHEISGVINEVGEAVSALRVGERVVVEPITVCSRCPACLQGQYELCGELNFLYRMGRGGLASYIEVSSRFVHPLPEKLSFEEGSLIEPLAVALHAWKKAEVKLGDSVCIVGCGPIGLLLVQLAKASGCKDIIAVGKRESRLNLALQMGATKVVDAEEEDVVAGVGRATANRGVNVSFEAVGSEQTLSQCLKVLTKKGRLVIVGLFSQDYQSLPVNLIVKNQITVQGSQAYCWDFQDAISLAAAERVDLGKMISHRFPLTDLQKALTVAADPEYQAVKVVCFPTERW